MRAIRGAICAHANTRPDIYEATQFLLSDDLNADFPAYAAREMGWTDVAMLGAQESLVPGGPQRAIRVLLMAEGEGPVRSVYLGRATRMRPDLAEPGDADKWDPEDADRKPTPSGDLGHLRVIGLGLIGGSLAAAARASGLFSEVSGSDRDPEVVATALGLGLVDSASVIMEAGLERADIVVLAVPVLQIIDVMGLVGPYLKDGCIVTDVGSTKRQVVDAMERLPDSVRAVAGHPMTGRTASGAASSTPDVFRGAKWALVGTSSSDDRAVETIEALVRCVGAEPVHMSAEEHDEMVALTSHLPALMAIELVQLAATPGVTARTELLFGPGFVSASRLAAGDPTMTTEMLATNADKLRPLARELAERLIDAADSSADRAELAKRVVQARALRTSLLESAPR
jgi:prephenate dehydrogenase/chorismate mutase